MVWKEPFFKRVPSKKHSGDLLFILFYFYLFLFIFIYNITYRLS